MDDDGDDDVDKDELNGSPLGLDRKYCARGTKAVVAPEAMNAKMALDQTTFMALLLTVTKELTVK